MNCSGAASGCRKTSPCSGFDNTSTSLHVNPPLSTMAQPLEEMGRMAVKKLLRSRDLGPKIMPHRLIERGSTAPPCTSQLDQTQPTTPRQQPALTRAASRRTPARPKTCPKPRATHQTEPPEGATHEAAPPHLADSSHHHRIPDRRRRRPHRLRRDRHGTRRAPRRPPPRPSRARAPSTTSPTATPPVPRTRASRNGTPPTRRRRSRSSNCRTPRTSSASSSSRTPRSSRTPSAC